MKKKTIVFDFDGVIHIGYNGWKDGSIYGGNMKKKLDDVLNKFEKEIKNAVRNDVEDDRNR